MIITIYNSVIFINKKFMKALRLIYWDSEWQGGRKGAYFEIPPPPHDFRRLKAKFLRNLGKLEKRRFLREFCQKMLKI